MTVRNVAVREALAVTHEWIFYASARRGEKWHLFEIGQERSVCASAVNRNHERAQRPARPSALRCQECACKARVRGIDEDGTAIRRGYRL